MLVCFVVAKKARNEIQQRQSEPPAWSDDLGRLITSDESLHFEGLQAVDVLERLQIVFVPPRELHDRQVMSLGNKHRKLRGSFERNLLRSSLGALGCLRNADDLAGSTGSPRARSRDRRVELFRAGREKIEVAGRVRGVDDRNRASADQEDDAASCQLAIYASEELEECRGFKLGRHAVRRGPGKNPPPCS